jgi:hypothetical protein
LTTDKDFTYLQLKYNFDDKVSNTPEIEPSKQKPVVTKYDKTYMFGKYNKIFGIKNAQTGLYITNTDIAKNITAVRDALKSGKPVFIIGYGQSGAGKTSSLVYLNPPSMKINEADKPGVIIDLCNMFGEGIDDGDGTKYTNIDLITQEFYKTTDPMSV